MPFKEALFWVGLTVFGAGLSFMIAKAKRLRWLAIVVTTVGAGAIAYSIYSHYYSEAPRLPIWLFLLILTWFLIGLDIYYRISSRDWREAFRTPVFHTVYDHNYENESILVDGKSFRKCSFKNVTFMFHGAAPFQFVEETHLDIGSIKFATDNPAISLYVDMQRKFASIPGAQLETGAQDAKGHSVPLTVPTVQRLDQGRNFPREVFTVQEVMADPPSTDDGVFYKDKIRIILTNVLDTDIEVWSPMWQASEVRAQHPLAARLQLEGKKGWKANDWGEEQSAQKVPVGITLRCWVGLFPPVGQSIRRRLQTNSPIGTAVFPVKINDKLYEIPIDITMPRGH